MTDNPIYESLISVHASFARVHGEAACFPAEVTALGGVRGTSARDLVALLDPGQRVGLFLRAPIDRAGLQTIDEDDIVQLVHAGAVDAATEAVLGAADSSQMQALAALTKPGPFGTRTHELGTFLGIRDGARLVAMAGQRLRLPGAIEVSAICTHPEYGGRGYARRLTAAQLGLVRAAGATAFLHVRASNARAIALYEALGFARRRSFRYVVLSR